MKEKKISNKHTYLNIYSHEVVTIDLIKLAKELARWAANNKEAFSIQEFFIEKGILSSEFARLLKRCEELKFAHEFAFSCIANRLESGALKKELCSELARFILPYYDSKYQNLEQWRAHLKGNNSGKSLFNTSLTDDKNDFDIIA